MTFKQGVLVILTKAINPKLKHMLGQVHELGVPALFHPDSWVLEGVSIEGRLVVWQQKDMVPLGHPGDDATDETLEWLPVPGKAVTA